LLDARYEESERMLLLGVEIDPQIDSRHWHLGILYLQTGDRARAFDHLILARDLGSAEAEALLNQYFP